MVKSTFSHAQKQFRELLIAARRRVKLRQVDLAARLSRPQSYVSKIESGERRVDLVEFLEISRALGIDPVKFVAKLARSIDVR
jgi:transcriptional regulator with XRE-family HTH domain